MVPTIQASSIMNIFFMRNPDAFDAESHKVRELTGVNRDSRRVERGGIIFDAPLTTSKNKVRVGVGDGIASIELPRQLLCSGLICSDVGFELVSDPTD